MFTNPFGELGVDRGLMEVEDSSESVQEEASTLFLQEVTEAIGVS